jgi:HPt (histidine-containing phosphotransfer) domain-containing protein
VDPSHKQTDLSYLNTISKGNKEFTLKFIRAFIKQMSEDLPLVQQYFDSQDWESLANIAHKIKPSFQFVGIKVLQESIAVIEKSARDQINLEDLPGLISNLMYICQIAISELNQEIELLNK